MAEKLTVARPYARAVFSEACDSNNFDYWHAALVGLAEVVRCLASSDIINNPKITSSQLESLCIDTLKSLVQVDSDFEQSLRRFIQLLIVEKRLNVVPEIAQIYHGLLSEHNKVIEVSAVSASPLSDAQKEALQQRLETRFESKVTIEYQQDATLIGGLIVKSDNWVFDGSIQSKLTRLAERII